MKKFVLYRLVPFLFALSTLLASPLSGMQHIANAQGPDPIPLAGALNSLPPIPPQISNGDNWIQMDTNPAIAESWVWDLLNSEYGYDQASRIFNDITRATWSPGVSGAAALSGRLALLGKWARIVRDARLARAAAAAASAVPKAAPLIPGAGPGIGMPLFIMPNPCAFDGFGYMAVLCFDPNALKQ